jgi:hypothetical protein
MTQTEKNGLSAAFEHLAALCMDHSCNDCPIALYFKAWEICPVEVIAKMLNIADHPERDFATCKHVVKGETFGVEYCEVYSVPEIRCNCPTCEEYKPREETK